MTKQTRRLFSPEYKERSVAQLSEPGARHSSVAAGLGVTPTQLKTWRLELEAAGSAAASAVQKAQAAELAQLRRDNKRLTEKVEVPAQSLGFFLDRHEACARDLNLLDPLTFFSKSEAATCPCFVPGIFYGFGALLPRPFRAF